MNPLRIPVPCTIRSESGWERVRPQPKEVMSRKISRRHSMALATAVGLALGACGRSADNSSTGSGDSAAQGSTVTIEDNRGTVDITLPVQRAASADNRTFEVLAQWEVPLVAVPKGLMPSTVTAYSGDDVANLKDHKEPDLEKLVAASPDLIISGQRFSQYDDQMAELNPGVPLLDLEPREGQPLDSELSRQVTALGQVFGKETEADQLVSDFNAALERAKNAYDGSSKVMAVDVSGGEIGYVAPKVGRTWGPLYDLLDLTPALDDVVGTDSHTGDDISVEKIADSNPEWILVLDRDGAISADKDDYTPAEDVIAGNSALQNVPAVTKGQVIYAPKDTYTNESIITYTEILGSMADAFEAAKSKG